MKEVYIISEIAQAHDGSLGILHSYIDALAKTGIDAVKFQTHISEAESSIYEPFRVNFSYEDKTRYDYWNRMSFSKDQWIGIKEHCDQVGLDFISSPFSQAAVDLLEEVNVCKYKIGSGEVNNLLMLEKIAKTGKEMIISSGMSSIQEIEETVNFLNKKSVNFSLLQCTSAYPTKPEDWGLNIIKSLKDKFKVPIGFSDHSGEIFSSLAAVSLGAEIIEFHAVFDKKMFGPDSTSSLTIDQITYLVQGIRKISESLNNPLNKNANPNKNLKKIFEKSLCVNKNIRKGQIIKFDDLEGKKPKGYGIDVNKFNDVINKKANKNLKKWNFINYSDIDENE